jgi:hypothetical protein
MSTNIKIISTKDYEDVIETVKKYVEGLRIGSVDTISNAFHKNAVMYGYTKGGLLGGPIDNLYHFIEKKGTESDIKTHLGVLATTDNCRGPR